MSENSRIQYKNHLFMTKLLYFLSILHDYFLPQIIDLALFFSFSELFQIKFTKPLPETQMRFNLLNLQAYIILFSMELHNKCCIGTKEIKIQMMRHMQSCSQRKMISRQKNASLEQFCQELFSMNCREHGRNNNGASQKTQLRKITNCLQKINKYLQQSESCRKKTQPICCPIILYQQPVLTPPIYLPSLKPIDSQKLYKEISTQQTQLLKCRNNSLQMQQSRRAKENKQNGVVLTSRTGLASRFKVCAIAVFFIKVFPKFCRKFTEIRRRWFIQRFLSPSCIQRKCINMINQMRNLDLHRIVRKVDERQPYISFTKLLLQQITSNLLQKNKVTQNNEIFGVGLLNNHFYLEYQNHYMYFPQEWVLLRKNKTRQLSASLLKIDQQTQFLLIVVRFIKIIVYEFLWGLYVSIQRANTTQFKNKFNLKQLIGVATVYLHSILVNMYRVGLQNFKQKYRIQTKNKQAENESLTSLETYMKKSKLRLLLSRSIFSHQNYGKDETNLHLLIPQFNEQYPFQYIEELPNFQQLNKKQSNLQELWDQGQAITNHILDFIVSMRQSLIQDEKEVYRKIWDKVLSQGDGSSKTKNQTKYVKLISDRTVNVTKNNVFASMDETEVNKDNRKRSKRHHSQNSEQLKSIRLNQQQHYTRSQKGILKTTRTENMDGLGNMRRSKKQMQMQMQMSKKNIKKCTIRVLSQNESKKKHQFELSSKYSNSGSVVNSNSNGETIYQSNLQ